MSKREGGCLCGEVRYRIDGAGPAEVAYCHCRMCQRSAGAPVMVWCSVPGQAFTWTKGRPRANRSSDKAGRLFCPDCGSQLVFRSLDEPDRLYVSVATLDEPEAVVPEHHIWASSRLPWFETTDALPRHAEGREADRESGPAVAPTEPRYEAAPTGMLPPPTEEPAEVPAGGLAGPP